MSILTSTPTHIGQCTQLYCEVFVLRASSVVVQVGMYRAYQINSKTKICKIKVEEKFKVASIDIKSNNWIITCACAACGYNALKYV